MVRRLLLPLLMLLPVACAGSPEPSPPPARDAVVVTSFDFAESALLGEVFAQALERADVPVRRDLRLGPRELVLPALRQGLVDVVPEYVGSALAAVDGDPTDRPDEAQAHARLRAALEEDGLLLLPAARAENTNGLAVLGATAQRLGLRTTSDLAAHAPGLVLAAPPECASRPYCLPGLERVYGLRFREVTTYAAESQRLTAVEQAVADVAVVFTTDGRLAAGDLVLLADDRDLQPPENVVPVVSRRAVDRHGDRVVEVLEQVSARLDTEALAFLNWRVEVQGEDLPGEAAGWLDRHDIGT